MSKNDINEVLALLKESASLMLDWSWEGTIDFEELPIYRYVLQMVGRCYTIDETDRWESVQPLSEIDLIGTGDESESLLLQLTRKLYNRAR